MTTFQVLYQSSVAKKSQSEIRLNVVDNQYEEWVIRVVAESYHDDISIDNVTSASEVADGVDELIDDDVPGTCSCAYCTII